MRQGSAGLIPVAVVAVFAALTFWLERATHQEERRDGRNRHDADYFVDNFTLRRFNAEGNLQHTLVATKMVHFPDDESTEVTAPRLTYHRVPPLYVSSDTAWLDKDGKHVRLDDNVRILREGIDGRLPTEIRTRVLYAIPDDEVAHTDAPVQIVQGQTVLNGTGLETNNKTQLSTLFGPTNGIIYNKQTNQAPSSNEKQPSKISAASPPAVDKRARPAARDGRKGRQGQARQPRSRPDHRR